MLLGSGGDGRGGGGSRVLGLVLRLLVLLGGLGRGLGGLVLLLALLGGLLLLRLLLGLLSRLVLGLLLGLAGGGLGATLYAVLAMSPIADSHGHETRTLMVARIFEKGLGDLGFSPSSSDEATFSFLPRKGRDDLRFSALFSFLDSPLVAGASLLSVAVASAGSA